MTRPLAELQSVEEQILADPSELAAHGILVNLVGLDVVENIVEVGVDDVQPAVVRLMLDRYGDAGQIVTAGPAELD